jgi:prolipoprotein diacylglyceryl transferase
MLAYPAIDPIAFSVGPLDIRWYGLAYVTGILLAWLLCSWLSERGYGRLSKKDLSDFVPWATLGIVAGGRLGHVLFYGGTYYLQHPAEIVMIWKPGMAFHGGLIGVIIAAICYCRSRNIRLLDLTDFAAVGTPIGLFFGRLANFINSELWGRLSEVPWAMVFPNGGPYPRHPSQLYEALLEGIVLLILQFVFFRYQHKKALRAGFTSGTFLIFYGVFRCFVELFRAPEDGFIGPLTTGQFLTLPFILLGLFLVTRSWKKA